ncbi:hypothetical protein [Rhizobium sp.]|uniref:hypothetical protein n=1 Tax=Rhizobium sp. TaxID=391 RepID=UPI00289C36FC
MNPILTDIINLRYAEPSARQTFLATIAGHIKADANYTNLAALLKYDCNHANLILVAVFAVWLDEISYAWDKKQRELQVEDLKTAAEELTVDYQAVWASRAYSEAIKDWLERNLLS